MNTARSNATSASSRIQPIVWDSLHRLCRAAAASCVVLAVLWLSSCTTVAPPAPAEITVAPPPLPARFVAADWAAVPGWFDDDVAAAWPAFRVGCPALVAAPATRPTWERTCKLSSAVDVAAAGAVRAFFQEHFTPYAVRAADGRDTGLVTGYYEPLLAGSRVRTSRFAIPLYAVPDDLLTVDLASLHPELKDKRVRARVDGRRVVPYWQRAEIGDGRAPVAGRELVWVENPVEAFFLEIQGSGRVVLADGSVLRVGYADQNGHPYRSIGRVLVDRGELPLERASMQGIRDWGRRNPDKLPALLNENPSVVFFREVPPPPPGSLEAAIDGPFGTLGVPLLRERTIAVDARSIPLGAPVFLATTHPLSSRPLRRLVMAQDTGGAIRGAVRADYFWGFGDAAGREAGRMRQEGRMWLLWPKDQPPP